MTELTILHVPERRRFEAHVAGEVAHLDYHLGDDHAVEFHSTYVPPAARNRGVGHRLVRSALAWAGKEQLDVVPTCSFVASVMRGEAGAAGGTEPQ